MTDTPLPLLTLPQMLRRNAAEIGGKIALRQKDFGIWQPVTWAEYHEHACAFAIGLIKLGLDQGGHLGILSENRVEWLYAQLGAGLAGSIPVGVYPTSPASEVAYVLAHSDANFVLCQDQEQADKVIEERANLPRIRRIIVIDPKGMRGYPQDQIITFEAVSDLGRAHAAELSPIIDQRLAAQSLDDIGLMVYTSGSTGKPKGALISYGNIRAEAAAMLQRMNASRDEVYLSYLPLCHVAEQIFTTMTPTYLGCQVNFGESLRTVVRDLQEVAPSLFLGVPRIWEKLHSAIHVKIMESGGFRQRLFERGISACRPFAALPASQRSLRQKLIFGFYYLLIFRALQNFIGLRKTRMAATGAAPISPQIVEFFRTIGVPLLELYGLTETTGAATGQELHDFRRGTVGPPLLGMEAKIGEQGELLLRGPLIFRGYYKNPEATAQAIQDNWLHTGDVAVIEDGHVRIVDRLKDIMITAGGKNLSPSEIEHAAKTSAFIKECVVIADGRKFVSALIQIDLEITGKWAEERGLAYTNFRSLAENSAVRDLIQAELDRVNGSLAQVAQIRRFHLLTKELDHDDDEVTATMKLRRANIFAKYAAEIEALYPAEKQKAAI